MVLYEIITEIQTMLGDAKDNFTEKQIEIAFKLASTEVEAYCNRSIDSDVVLGLMAERIAVIKLNRTNTEGLANQSYSGVAETYEAGYPADIISVLNAKRRIKVVK